MMHKFTLLLFFILQIAVAQNLDITIVVKDFETDLPIDEVTITAIKTKQGFLTNAEGKVILHLTKPSDLEFVHSSYRTYIVKFSTLIKKENVVYLEPITQQLEEVILTREHPQEILKQLVKKSKNQITIPVNLKIYLREF